MRMTILLFALAACGGSITGVKKSTQLKDLTAEQVCDAAEGLGEYAEDALSRSQGCYLGAQIAAAFSPGGYEAACEAAYDECMNAEEEDEDPIEDEEELTCDPDASYPVDASCTATIGDLEDCVRGVASIFREIANHKCTQPTDDDDEFDPNDERLDACKIMESCATDDNSTPPTSGPPSF